MTLMIAIVVVEDDAQIRAALVRSLSARGYDARGSADGLAQPVGESTRSARC